MDLVALEIGHCLSVSRLAYKSDNISTFDSRLGTQKYFL